MKTQVNKKLNFKKNSLVELNERKLSTINGGGPTNTNPILLSVSHIDTGTILSRYTSVLCGQLPDG